MPLCGPFDLPFAMLRVRGMTAFSIQSSMIGKNLDREWKLILLEQQVPLWRSHHIGPL
jgi:hypothetical protein